MSDPTGWFEELYASAAAGERDVPWDRGAPRPLLVEWATARRLDGRGRRALVIGAGLGWDAEYVASLGFATVAFDVSETAVRLARERHPGSPVSYAVADLLAPPAEWAQAFDLVVECLTIQALPPELHERASVAAAGFVAPAGTLLVIAAAADAPPAGGPPWPLTRCELTRFFPGLRTLHVERIDGGEFPRWRAEYARDPGAHAGVVRR